MPELNTLGAAIKATYESEADTNGFTDAEKSKLGGLATVAESGDYADLTGKPAVIAEGNTAAEARAAIGAVAETEKANPDGVATLDSSGVVPLEQINVSSLTYLGGWDASANTPELLDGEGSVGNFYKVTVAGTQNFGSGEYAFGVGDWVIYAAGTWQRVGVHEAVASVNGKTGAVSLTASDVGALPDDYTPPAATWASISGKPDFPELYAPKMRGSISAPIPAAYARLASSQSYSSADNLDISWTNIIYDPFSIKSNDHTFTVPAWATHVRATLVLEFDENSTGYRFGAIRRNGSTVFSYREAPVSGHSTHLCVNTAIFPVSAGDGISASLWQNSGGALNLQTPSTWLQIELYTTN